MPVCHGSSLSFTSSRSRCHPKTEYQRTRFARVCLSSFPMDQVLVSFSLPARSQMGSLEYGLPPLLRRSFHLQKSRGDGSRSGFEFRRSASVSWSISSKISCSDVAKALRTIRVRWGTANSPHRELPQVGNRAAGSINFGACSFL